MQLFHSFNHKLAFGSQLKIGLLQLVSRSNKNKSEQNNNPDISWLEQAILTEALGAKGIWVADPVAAAPLINRVENLSKKFGIDPPKKILIYDHPDSNAAVMINGTMAISTGLLLNRLPDRELNAVIAHELSHLKRYKTNIGLTIGALAVSGAAALYGYLKTAKFGKRKGALKKIGWGIISLPVAGAIFEGISYLTAIPMSAYVRRNEMVADREAAEVTGDPEAMANVLQRIERDHEARYKYFVTERLGQSAGEEQYKPSMWKEIKAGLKAPLRSHPPTHKRISQLREMAASMENKPYERQQQAQYTQQDTQPESSDPTYWRQRHPQQHSQGEYRERERQRTEQDSFRPFPA